MAGVSVTCLPRFLLCTLFTIRSFLRLPSTLAFSTLRRKVHVSPIAVVLPTSGTTTQGQHCYSYLKTSLLEQPSNNNMPDNNNDPDDFFGDDSFLADFDVDAAISKRGVVSINDKENTVDPQNAATTLGVGEDPAAKRVKRMLSTPSSGLTTTALHATKNPQARQSPRATTTSTTTATAIFPPGSQFSISSGPDQDLYKDEQAQTSNRLPSKPSSTPKINHKVIAPLADIDVADNKELTSDLEQTLKKHFGFNTFRSGQLQVLHSIMKEQDAAVFMATGAGKSICYQIPPLHTGDVAIVVSPLISLMQDQVNKLNGLSSDGRKLATFLGSSQPDPTEEDKAMDGKYPLVYVTPEKLTADGFLDRLATMHRFQKKLCLVAIDESHCVSEWGHDFRPEFRNFGDALRSHDVLKQVPLLALTATAVPRVQQDIITSLQLRTPYICRRSFDRSNLKITVHKKTTGGFQAAMEPLVTAIQQNPQSLDGQSTIVYVPSRGAVDEIAAHLQHQLPNISVEAYHAGLPNDVRSRAHTNFLVGRTTIIVATIAFGMGIDKPDTRRIVHFGPPKTVEEYYQQIGRAGRDGMSAECIMYVNEHDFAKYQSDFYLGRLNGEVRTAAVASMDSLRNFALDTETCRRKALLSFFDETPSFGDRCGTCDNCRNHVRYGADSERDFGRLGARVILKAVAALDCQSMGVIEKVIGSNTVEDYRYKGGQDATTVAQEILSMKEDIGKKRSKEYFKELFSPLVSKGYLSQSTKRADIGGYARSWGIYEITLEGKKALNDSQIPIKLPVPPSLREVERVEEQKLQAMLSELKEAGVNIEELPKEELENGEGEAIYAYKKWHNKVKASRRSGNDDRADELEDLHSRIHKWRLQAAEQFEMAPVSILAEHIISNIAYMVSTMPAGSKIERDSLITAGVRTRAIDALVATLSIWIGEQQQKNDQQKAFKKWHGKIEALRKGGNEDRVEQLEDLYARICSWRSERAEECKIAPSAVLAEQNMMNIAYTVSTMSAGSKIEREALMTTGVVASGVDALVATLNTWISEAQIGEAELEREETSMSNPERMILPSEPITPAGPWEYAVYKVVKKTGKASWESSQERFSNGEHPQAISMKPENGKPIQVTTVISHLWEGLIQGRPVSLERLAQLSSPPNKEQWDRLGQCEIETGINVRGDPKTCNNGDKFSMASFLSPIMGPEFASIPYEDRSDEDKSKFSKYCEALRWYTALRRVEYDPIFVLSEIDKSQEIDI